MSRRPLLRRSALRRGRDAAFTPLATHGEGEGAIVPSPVARHGAGGVPYIVTLRGVRLLGGT